MAQGENMEVPVLVGDSIDIMANGRKVSVPVRAALHPLNALVEAALNGSHQEHNRAEITIYLTDRGDGTYVPDVCKVNTFKGPVTKRPIAEKSKLEASAYGNNVGSVRMDSQYVVPVSGAHHLLEPGYGHGV